MKALNPTRRFMTNFSFVTAIATVFIALLPSLSKAQTQTNNIVAYVFDRPIYQADLRYDAHGSVSEDLRNRIVGPVLDSYQESYRSLLKPNSYELKAAGIYLRRAYLARMMHRLSELSSDGQENHAHANAHQAALNALHSSEAELAQMLMPMQNKLAKAIVSHWKFQRHVYDFYGGGRVTMHAFGPEAVDATINWLKVREAHGDFKFVDRKLKQEFYAYWSEASLEDAELVADEDKISIEDEMEKNRQELLMPEWLIPALPMVQK